MLLDRLGEGEALLLFSLPCSGVSTIVPAVRKRDFSRSIPIDFFDFLSWDCERDLVPDGVVLRGRSGVRYSLKWVSCEICSVMFVIVGMF